MRALQKTAAFLLMIGLERGRNVFSLLDSDEIKNVAAAIDELPSLTIEMQDEVRREFIRRGYSEEMKAPELLDIIRGFFNGGKISEQFEGKRFGK